MCLGFQSRDNQTEWERLTGSEMKNSTHYGDCFPIAHVRASCPRATSQVKWQRQCPQVVITWE